MRLGRALRRRRPRGGRRISAAVLAGLLALPSPAGGSAQGPSLTASTTISGVVSPVTLASGEWTYAGGIWSLTLGTGAPPGGRTVVTSTWRSPRMSARGGAAFAMVAAVRQQEAAGVYSYASAARACWTGGCTPWHTHDSDSVPSMYAVETLPWQVEHQYDLRLTLRPVRRTVWFEWRYRQTQDAASVGETAVRVAVGEAARTLA